MGEGMNGKCRESFSPRVKFVLEVNLWNYFVVINYEL